MGTPDCAASLDSSVYKESADMRERGNVPASSGGCWYCEHDDGIMPFSMEFDCYLHVECLRDRLNEAPNDLEALIIARELASDYDMGVTVDEIQQRIDHVLE